MKATKLTLFLAILLLGFLNAKPNVTVPGIFTSNMVLQQQSDVKIWGWAKPGEPVILTADWLEKAVETKASNHGKWQLVLPTPAAGGPYSIKIKGYNEIVFSNVLIGEVWLCSGQSNMEWSALSGIINKDAEIAEANHPEIRFYTVPTATSEFPQDQVVGEWKVCSPGTMAGFSAVAYFFGRRLQAELGVPVGLINSSWGGTPAEAWMPENVILGNPVLKEAAALQKPVPWGPVESGSIYNSMIAPLIPFKIAGVLWYQGEGNTINGSYYKALLSGLIASWRSGFGSDFPFYFAQIAPYRYGNPFEGTIVREQQRKTLEIPNTGMVILSDIGDTLDIHPKNKQDVGLRFANMALNRHYKTIKTEDSGPLYKEMKIDKNKIVVFFNHAAGLHVKGEKATCFEIAGADKVFYQAEATVKNDQVIVESKKVKDPVMVRFAWKNTATPNLFNGANLPASCFSSE